MLRWFHTVRHLRATQFLALRPALHRRRPRILAAPSLRKPQGSWQPAIAKENPWKGGNRVRLLNEEREVRAWDAPEWPRLWAYTLHYFDFPTADSISDWIAKNPAGHGVGWQPYPNSRRIVNWIKFALAGNELPQQALSSLATQAEHLAATVEHRVLANHILANGKALFFAGMFFDGNVAERWRTAGLRILLGELREQILADGGHYERSAMYHALVLEDVLDLCNLARTYGTSIPGLSDAARRMLGWMRCMTHPDGGIPFFNDAAFGMAPTPEELSKYAARLGLHAADTSLNESGYIRLENEGTVVLFDAGPIGPDYQPGHAHADTLSFEMSTERGRVLVNSGTSTYAAGPQRDWERGTAAHNTVRVDGVNQSETWHSFRVARRAKPLSVGTDHRTFAEAAHDGYRRLAGNVVHRRRICLTGRSVEITDTLEGRGTHEIEIFFHVYPDADPQIRLDDRLKRSVITTTYHPGFNVSVPKKTVIGQYRGKLPVTFVTHISAE